MEYRVITKANHFVKNVVPCQHLWKNTRAYQNITNNAYSHINAELLLISGLNDSTRILLCPQVIVKIHYIIPYEACLICKQH
jgi:hypothetical protein